MDIPIELTQVLDSEEFEGNGCLRVANARWWECNVTIDVRVHTGDESRPLLTWQVRCFDVRASRIAETLAYSIALVSDHPLLLPFQDPSVTLSFAGMPLDIDATIGRLWQKHDSMVADWINFSTYFNKMGLTKLLASGAGVLAQGPKSLLLAYADVLSDSGVEPIIHSEFPPRRWWRGEWVEAGQVQALLLPGSTHVVANDFTFAPT